LNRSISTNKNDFFSLDKIDDIPDNYFFSFRDIDGFVYSFDIRSIENLIIDGYLQNPFNRKDFSNETLSQLNKRKKQLKNYNIRLDFNSECIELTDKQKFNLRVLEIFQKLNRLGHYAMMDWFTNLSIGQLKKWYKEAEDIFNYRANLTENKKLDIIPDGQAFHYSIDFIYSQNDKRKLQNIILEEIDRFISLGKSKNDQYTGSLYMLTAFTEVSIEAANSLPWLYQPNI